MTTAQLPLEPADDAVDTASFREAMTRFASTVSVVTTVENGVALGRTATAIMSLAVAPPTILVSIDRQSALAASIVNTQGFSVSVLAQDQQMVGDAFAGKLGPIDRFLVGVWGEWTSGRPLLLGASVALDCRVVGTIETDGHLLFAGAVIATESNNPAAPLLWHRRRYRRLSSVGAVPAEDLARA